VNCSEFQERISSAADRYLSPREQEEFDRHADRCPPCRREFEMEVATKLVLRRRAHMVSVPPGLQQTILSRIRRETGSGIVKGEWWLSAHRRRHLVGPTLAFALAALGIALVVDRDSTPPDIGFPFSAASLGPDDVIGQSLRNFHGVLSGEIRPQLMSSSAEDLRRFFNGRTEFPVVVPDVREWKLVGGGMDEHRGSTLVHLVYECEGEYVYVYQACWNTVLTGKSLHLSPGATADLVRSGWFTRHGPRGDAVVAWTRGGALCVAVAHMDQDHLLRCLQSGDSVSVLP
jgi:anti-sigma factor (TIGR02949 family)